MCWKEIMFAWRCLIAEKWSLQFLLCHSQFFFCAPSKHCLLFPLHVGPHVCGCIWSCCGVSGGRVLYWAYCLCPRLLSPPSPHYQRRQEGQGRDRTVEKVAAATQCLCSQSGLPPPLILFCHTKVLWQRITIFVSFVCQVLCCVCWRCIVREFL